MGKVFNLLLLSSFVMLGLFLFDASFLNATPIFSLMINPNFSAGIDFWTGFAGAILGAAGLVGLFIGAVILKQDWLIRAGMATTLFSWIVLPFVDLWLFVATKTSNLALSDCVGTSCLTLSPMLGVSGMGAIVAFVFVGPILIYSVWAIFEYVWGGDR